MGYGNFYKTKDKTTDANFAKLYDLLNKVINGKGKLVFISSADPEDVSLESNDPGSVGLASDAGHIHKLDTSTGDDVIELIIQEINRIYTILSNITGEEVSWDDVDSETIHGESNSLLLSLMRNRILLERVCE